MLTLGAAVVTLAFLAGVVHPLSVPETPAGVPVPVEALNAPVPLPLKTNAKPSGPTGKQAKGGPAGGAGATCPVMATYRLSADKLQDYLNGSLPAKIEELVRCSDVNLAGLVGSLLNTVCNGNLLNMLPLDAVSGITGLLPLGDIGGLLGKGSSPKGAGPAEGADAAALPVPPVGPDALPVPIPGAEPALAAAADSVNQLTKDVSAKAKSLTGATDSLLKGVASTDLGKLAPLGALQKLPTTDLLNNILPSAGSGGDSGLLGGLDLSELLLNLKVEKVTVQSITYSTTDHGMEAQASVTADVTAEGAAGSVVTLLGFEVDVDITMVVSSTHDPTNNTLKLAVEQKSMEAKEVKIKLLKTVTGITDALPLPVPLPLPVNDVVLMVLTVELTENAKTSKCSIQLDDFDTGKNGTGEVCQYTIATTKISADGLTIAYCAKCTWNKIPIVMPGNVMPKHLKNDSISLILSHKAVKRFVGQCVEPARVKVDDVEARIIDLSYTYPTAETVEACFKFMLKKGGRPYGIARTVALYSHNCRAANGKLLADVRMNSSPKISTMPPAIMDEMPGLMSAVLPKAVSAITECVSKWNLPPGVSLYPLPPSKITTLKSNDLHMGK